MLIYAIGDVHGCYDELSSLLAKIGNDADDEYQIIFLGDYVDRGPKSRQVLDLVQALPNAICLKGNHEDMMVQAYDEANIYGGTTDWWLSNGGVQTLESFGWDRQSWPKGVGPYVLWMRNLPLFHETDTHIFVHAGLYPEIPLSKQNPETMMWVRDVFLNSSYDWGKKVVHGHTITRDVVQRPNRIGLDTGCFHTGVLSAMRFPEERVIQNA